MIEDEILEEQNDDSKESSNDDTPTDHSLEHQLRQRHDFSAITVRLKAAIEETSKVLIGQDELIELMLICLLAEGHILIEGVPGIAKTLSSKVFAKVISADFSRIQFTPDLMPSDILGTSIFNMKDSKFEFKKGPIFSNIILIDEINRSPAKTQSALFQVMAEKEIDYDGINYVMEPPFMVLATQNPIEQEGTYRLPEGQLDRFLMKVIVEYPSQSEELEILHRFKQSIGPANIESINSILSRQDLDQARQALDQVYVEDSILNYIVLLVEATRNHGKIYLGASPRASLALLNSSKVAALLAGRDFIVPEEITFVAPHILNHRLILTAEAEMQGVSTFEVIEEIIKNTDIPR